METQLQRTWMPTVAGVLDICAGVSAVLGSVPVGMIAIVAGTVAIPTHFSAVSVPARSFAGLFLALAVLLLASGVIAIVGGIHVAQRNSRFWSIAGAIAAVFSFFPFGIPAVILTVLCEGELAGGSVAADLTEKQPKD